MVAALARGVPVAGPEALIAVAARNNAAWCDALCRTHAIVGRFTTEAWTSPTRTPPFYPDAVTLDPSAISDRILGRIDTATAGASVKDSFACLDLTMHGFEIAHEAMWIHRPAEAPSTDGPTTTWARVRTVGELAAWATAWDGTGAPDGLFRPELLEVPEIRVLAAWSGDRATAGAIVNRTGDVVGISNLFASDGEGAWRGCLATVARAFPGRSLVGYEAGEELEIARRAGFRAIGPLRVWAAGG